MAPKKSGRTRKVISIETKKEIIAKYEKGVKQKDLARKFGLHKNTIQTILSKREQIKTAKVAKGISKLTSLRTPLGDEMEQLLLIWLREREMKGEPASQEIIREQAKIIYNQLKKKVKKGVPFDQKREFKASKGWFHKFCKRTGVQKVMLQEEAVNVDDFVIKFQALVSAEGYLPQQIFKADETTVFWKKMPSRSYIAQEEKSLGINSNDKFTLLLSANCSGDLKLKPVLVYSQDHPKAFQKKNIIRTRLPVFWRSNANTCITQVYFREWVSEIFAPSVESYLQMSGLPLQALLLLDSPPEGSQKALTKYPWLKILHLPPVLQPMNQLVVGNFKKLYVRALFRYCYEKCEFSNTESSIKQFWTREFDIVDGVKLVQTAWDQVPKVILNVAWRFLIPEFVRQLPPEDDEKLTKETIATAKELLLKVDEFDIEEMITGLEKTLTFEELQALTQGSNEMFDDVGEDEELPKNSMPITVLTDLIRKWDEIRRTVNEWHPNQIEAVRLGDFYNDNAIRPFRLLLRKRNTQAIDTIYGPSTSRTNKIE